VQQKNYYQSTNSRELMNGNSIVTWLLNREVMSAIESVNWGESQALKAVVSQLVCSVLAAPAPITLMEWRERAEAAAIALAVKASNGNISAAARNLGLSRVTMYRLMKKYGVARADNG
jgi:transcriptional regulator of acetoin/glycerol metabolism